MENCMDEVAGKLKRYKKEDITFRDHARMQAAIRGVEMEEVMMNLLEPSKLFYAKRQEAKEEGEEKFDCYFRMSKKWAHRYVIVMNKNLIVITIVRANKNWQKWVEKNAKIQV